MYMQVSASNQPITTNRKYARAAAKGALLTSGALTVSSAVSWASDSAYMKQVVKNTGGKAKYAATYALGLAVLTAAGALLSTALTFIADKITPKKPPKAV